MGGLKDEIMKTFTILFAVLIIVLTYFLTCCFPPEEVEFIQAHEVKRDVQKERLLRVWRLHGDIWVDNNYQIYDVEGIRVKEGR